MKTLFVDKVDEDEKELAFEMYELREIMEHNLKLILKYYERLQKG